MMSVERFEDEEKINKIFEDFNKTYRQYIIKIENSQQKLYNNLNIIMNNQKNIKKLKKKVDP